CRKCIAKDVVGSPNLPCMRAAREVKVTRSRCSWATERCGPPPVHGAGGGQVEETGTPRPSKELTGSRGAQKKQIRQRRREIAGRGAVEASRRRCTDRQRGGPAGSCIEVGGSTSLAGGNRSGRDSWLGFPAPRRGQTELARSASGWPCGA